MPSTHLCLSAYHLSNCQTYLDVSQQEMAAVGPQKVFSHLHA
jgi:hypothetical protein